MAKLGIWNDLLNSSILEQGITNKTLLLLGGSSQTHKSIVQSLLKKAVRLDNSNVGRDSTISTFGYSFVPLPGSQLHVYSVSKPSLGFSKVINNALKESVNIQIVYLIEEADLNIEESLISPKDLSFTANSEMILERVTKALGPSIKFTKYLNELNLDKNTFTIALKNISQLSYNVNTMKTLDFLQQFLRLIMLGQNEGSLIYFDTKNMDDLSNSFLKLLDNKFNKAVLDDFSAIKVPPKFDTIEKIKALNEEFDFELWSEKWNETIGSVFTNDTVVNDTTEYNGNSSIISAKYKYQSFLRSLHV